MPEPAANPTPAPAPNPLNADPAPAPAPADPANPTPNPLNNDPAPAPAPADPAAAPADPTPAGPTWFSADADWRKEIAGDDESKLNVLKRYTDPNAMANALFEARGKLNERAQSAALPDDASDEQVAEWREANDVPATAADYKLEGVELAEIDREELAPKFETYHSMNLSNAQVTQLVAADQAQEAREIELLQQQHNLDMQETTKLLKAEWKGDYEPNINLIKGLFSSVLPGDMLDAFFTARMGTGKALFNSPEVMNAFADMARKINPAATLVPNVANPRQSIEGRIAELQKMMAEPGWHKNTAANQELDQLLVAQEELNRQGQ